MESNLSNTTNAPGLIKAAIIDLNVGVFSYSEMEGYTKTDFTQTLKKVSQRRKLPVGEHIREAIQTFKGNKD